MAEFLFDLFGFKQTSKANANSTEAAESKKTKQEVSFTREH